MKAIPIFLVLSVVLIPKVFAKTLVVNIDNGNPPFMFGTSNKPQGIYKKMLSETFSMMNLDIDIRAVPWKRLLAEMNKGVSGGCCMYKNTERLKKYDFSDPIFTERLVLYSLQSKQVNFDKVEDLSGMRIGIIRGWSYNEEFDRLKAEKRIKAVESGSDEQNFKMLKQGRLEAVIAITEAADLVLGKLGISGKVVASPKPLAVNHTYLAFPKSMKKKQLLEKFNAASKKRKNNG